MPEGIDRVTKFGRLIVRLPTVAATAMLLVTLGACTGAPVEATSPAPQTTSASGEPSGPTAATPSPTTPVSTAAPSSATPSTSPSATPTRQPEPRWDKRNKFYSSDKRLYVSDWYAGRGRIMIAFGCTEAPYYDPNPKCDNGQGFHHGTDVALPCGTELRSAVSGTVTDPGRAGTPGGAYGSKAFRIHDPQRDVDILIAHPSKVFVSPGDKVSVGDRIALTGAEGAPDGCHLHLEVRPARGGVSSADDPSDVLALEAVT